MRSVALPFLIVLGSVVMYFLLAMGFGVYQQYPLLHLVGTGLGSIWLIALFVKERTIGRALIALVALFLSVGYAWYTLSYSNYETRSGAVGDGQVLAELGAIELADHEGVTRAVFPLDDGRATLLILYRGYW